MQLLPKYKKVQLLFHKGKNTTLEEYIDVGMGISGENIIIAKTDKFTAEDGTAQEETEGEIFPITTIKKFKLYK